MIVCQHEIENYSKYEKGTCRHLLYGYALSVLSASICSDFDMHWPSMCLRYLGCVSVGGGGCMVSWRGSLGSLRFISLDGVWGLYAAGGAEHRRPNRPNITPPDPNEMQTRAVSQRGPAATTGQREPEFFERLSASKNRCFIQACSCILLRLRLKGGVRATRPHQNPNPPSPHHAPRSYHAHGKSLPCP